jgi:hypothetical protein
LLVTDLQPCYGDSPVALRRLTEVGSLVKCISLTYPKFQQREVKGAWLTWCGADKDDGTSTVKERHKNRRKFCSTKWSSFQPSVSFSFIGDGEEEEDDNSECSGVSFTNGKGGSALQVPLFLADIHHEKGGEIINSSKVQLQQIGGDLKSTNKMTIDATVKVKVNIVFSVLAPSSLCCFPN